MKKLHALAVGFALVSAACSGGGPLSSSGIVVYNANYPFYSRSDYVYAASGDFPVDVRGNPLPVAQPVFEQAVVDAMQGTTWGPPAYFVVQPEGRRPDSRIVLGFGTSTNVNIRALCETPSGADTRFEGRPVVVAAAFCNTDRALSRVLASAPDISGPSDPRLASLMSQVVGQLLPPENPERRDNDDNCGFGLGGC